MCHARCLCDLETTLKYKVSQYMKTKPLYICAYVHDLVRVTQFNSTTCSIVVTCRLLTKL
jgi:hypothetical protein